MGDIFFGAPPDTWDQWTHQAEEKLLQATGTDATGNQGRGAALKLARQRISRPQAGSQAVGTNLYMHRLRLRIAQHDRLLTFESRSSSLAEVSHLRHILLRAGYPTQKERDLLGRWLQAIPKRRQKGWLDWAAQQLARSGAELCKWAQRHKPEDHLTTLSPAPSRGMFRHFTNASPKPRMNGPNCGKEGSRGAVPSLTSYSPFRATKCDMHSNP